MNTYILTISLKITKKYEKKIIEYNCSSLYGCNTLPQTYWVKTKIYHLIMLEVKCWKWT